MSKNFPAQENILHRNAPPAGLSSTALGSTVRAKQERDEEIHFDFLLPLELDELELDDSPSDTVK